MITPPMLRQMAAAKAGPPKGAGEEEDKPRLPSPVYAFEVMDYLQTKVAPEKFIPRGSYDGRANLFMWGE